MSKEIIKEIKITGLNKNTMNTYYDADGIPLCDGDRVYRYHPVGFKEYGTLNYVTLTVKWDNENEPDMDVSKDTSFLYKAKDSSTTCI